MYLPFVKYIFHVEYLYIFHELCTFFFNKLDICMLVGD